MRLFCVVRPSPLFDQDLRLAEAVEDLPVQNFIAKADVDAFAIAILSKQPGLNVSRLFVGCADPVPNG